MDCPICTSTGPERSRRLYDDRYGYPGHFDLWHCPGCGHRFLAGDFTPELLSRLYTEYYPRKSIDLERFRPRTEARGFSAWLNGEKRSAHNWIPREVRILDVGCGFGESLAYHVQRGCDAYGVEADENARRAAEKFGFKIHVGLFDPDIYEPDFFDYVTLDQVVEHFTDPVATLQGVAKVLKPGGTAILSTPNPGGWGVKVFGRRWVNWHAPYHLQHFSKESMRTAAERSGLKLEESLNITSSDWLHYQWIHLATYPGMGIPSPYWSFSLRGWRIVAIKALEKVHRTRANHLLTRLFDALGAGDNFLFFLKKP